MYTNEKLDKQTQVSRESFAKRKEILFMGRLLDFSAYYYELVLWTSCYAILWLPVPTETCYAKQLLNM